jgi:hypothetical protein
LEYKFEHLYKPDGIEKTCNELIAEDVNETISAMKAKGKPINAENIYEAIEQRVSLDDIRKVLFAHLQTTCATCGAKLFAPDPIHICRSKR